MSNTFGLNIRHHSNGGEVSFGRMYRADGVCYENNTVYEFHGDIFHGNPEMFKPDDTPNYFHPNLTAKEMHDRTLAKEEFLRDLGWNYVHIWESEYRRQYNLHSTWKKFFKATLPSKKDQDAVLRVGTKPVYIRAFETPTAEDRNINLTALRTNMGGKKLHSKDDEITILWDGLEVDVTVEYSTNNYLEFWYWDETYKDYHLYCMRVS